ncbi:MAG: 1-deoxy-D-xylulose-5-phosphate reductoisomerase [Candidatus Limnocylindria bacterium]|nr:1-deoxy-D-xylulose-5-phosphate reductoisomerase [Candidatus Limnocylindria bacterium]
MTTRLAILGATGSVGQQALDVVRAHPDALRVVAVQARSRAAELRLIASAHGARALLGEAGLDSFVTADDVDLVLVATPGIAGLVPTLAALAAGKSVALANKEVLVAGGHLVRAAAAGAGTRLRPVDSEHCALWQCLAGERMAEVTRVVLTASGGPFRDRPLTDLARVTPEEALRHPTWRMGPKVTIDSATLANKGYEVVEARWLYDLPYERIDVLLHPQSVVHALVEFADGSVKAQLAAPDMRLPIQYALLGERHLPGPAARLDLVAVGRLDFRAVEPGRYPCLEAVLETARSGDGGALVGLSAADELAVERFLEGALAFDRIADLLRRGADEGARLAGSRTPALEEVLAIDAGVRRTLSATAGVR